MGQIKLVGSLLMALLFGIAILGFASNVAIDNDSSIKITDDADFVTIQTELGSNAENFKTDSNGSINTLIEASIEPGDETTATGGQFKIGVRNSLSMMKFMVNGVFKKVFGSDSEFGIFLTALVSFLGFILGLYIWKTWRGNPD